MTCPRSNIKPEAKLSLWKAPAPAPERRENTYRVGMLKGVSLACMVEKKNFQLTIQCVKTILEKKDDLKDIYQEVPINFTSPLKPDFNPDVP